MFFKISSFALIGIEAIEVSVEMHISSGIPTFTIVGLPDKAINESRLRVKAAILNSGFKFPTKKIIVNLSPAEIKKEGVFYDLPIAIAILIISSQITNFSLELINNASFVGELSLDGKLNPVRGIISMSEKCQELNKKFFFIPYENSSQASSIKGIKFICSKTLLEITRIISNKNLLNNTLTNIKSINIDSFKDTQKQNIQNLNIDFSDVKGQLKAKRAIEIAVGGMHNIIMVGPPGAGKTMLAQRIITIMPELAIDESIEVTKIYSLYKKYNDNLITVRPFRNPHHSISRSSFLGGGIIPKPGEISLAHKGVLFLDEFFQFPKSLIEDLRQPIEDKEIIISRNNLFYKFPCNFMLVIATNPCYCGYYQDESKKCKCTDKEIENYWKNISGPILDRIDMRINIPRLDSKDFFKNLKVESSLEIRKRIRSCHEIQKSRYKNYKNFKLSFNSEADTKIINTWLEDNKKLKETIQKIFKNYNLTGRAFSSILKVSRTIADIDQSENIKLNHVMEALNFRISFINK